MNKQRKQRNETDELKRDRKRQRKRKRNELNKKRNEM